MYSWEHFLIKLVDSCTNALDEDQFAGTIMVDFVISWAF